MRLVRAEDIGILFMSELARQPDRELVSLTQVSGEHGVSGLFLKKIARRLKQAQLVVSKEGSGGGYRLAGKPEAISLWQIIAAVSHQADGRILADKCPLVSVCLPQTIHNKVYRALVKSLSAISLSEIVQ